jgi:glycosyltransferase involved in cell wall biosynthesis
LRINYVMWTVGPSGGHRTLFELANRLFARGHEVSITALYRDRSQWFPVKVPVAYAYEMASNIEAIIRRGVLAMKRRHLLQLHLDDIRTLAKAIPACDVNVASFCFTAFAVHRSGKGHKRVYHIQNLCNLGNDYERRMGLESYFLPLSKIVNSTRVRKGLEALNAPGPFTTIFPGVDLNTFKPTVQKASKPRVICYGSTQPWKGFGDALKAIEMARKKVDVDFIVFGPRRPLEGGEYTFVERPSDAVLVDLYSSSHILLNTSWAESFPTTVQEAMACGTPAVAVSVGAEDLLKNGENALLIPPHSPERASEAIVKLFEDHGLLENLRQGALKTISAYGWERVVDRFEAFFQGT